MATWLNELRPYRSAMEPALPLCVVDRAGAAERTRTLRALRATAREAARSMLLGVETGNGAEPPQRRGSRAWIVSFLLLKAYRSPASGTQGWGKIRQSQRALTPVMRWRA